MLDTGSSGQGRELRPCLTAQAFNPVFPSIAPQTLVFGLCDRRSAYVRHHCSLLSVIADCRTRVMQMNPSFVPLTSDKRIPSKVVQAVYEALRALSPIATLRFRQDSPRRPQSPDTKDLHTLATK